MGMPDKEFSFTGILIALLLISAWFAHLVVSLTQPMANPLWILIHVLLQTVLFSGLFITAHDAMHGTIIPKYPALNHSIGRVSVALYALFSYTKLLEKHKLHHRYPGSAKDPDFHPPGKPQFIFWYTRFIRNYINLPQFIGMAIVFNILLHVFHIPWRNLMLFWVLPSLLSTIQLFYFGTYLPHRETNKGFPDAHRAHSLMYPNWISLLTCFHFGGFHWEHHLYPDTPWWRLPQKKSASVKEKERPI